MTRRTLTTAVAAMAVFTTVGVLVAPVGPVAAAGTQPLSTGLNADGQLGNGSTTNRTSPGPVSLPATIVQIASGREHAYALDDAGRIWAWGDNRRGAVGDGTTVDRPTPVRLALTNVAEVEAGHYHGIARRTDGTVWTWGYGALGQLGLGTTKTRTSPVVVPGLSGIVEIGDGRDQSFAMNAAGEVWAWGHNDAGQLGDGTTTNRTSPVRISGLSGIVSAQGGRGMTIFLAAPSGADPDVTPPSTPGTPTASSTVSGRVDLAWAASSDDRASQITYTVFRDGGATPIASVVGGTTGTIAFADVGRTPGAVHTYTVRASDGTNTSGPSAASAPVTVAGGGGGGPDPLLADDFTSGLAGWTVSGAFALDSTDGSPAAPSARSAVNGTAGDARRGWGGSPTSVCAAFDVRVASVSGTARYSLVKLRNGAGASVARVEVNAQRQLFVRADVPGTRFTVGTQLPFGSWQRLTLCASNGASGTITLQLGGAPLGSWNANLGTQPITQIQLGDNDPRTATVNWDSLHVTPGA